MKIPLLATFAALCLSGAAQAAAPYYQFTITNNNKLVESFSLNATTGTRGVGAYSDYVWYFISNDTLGRTAAYFGDSKVQDAFGTGYVNSRNPTINGPVTSLFLEDTSIAFFSGKGSNINVYPGEVVQADCYVITITPAPEPATWFLIMGGVGFIGGALRLNRRRRGDARSLAVG